MFTGKMNLELKKKIIRCLVWSVALYTAEMWTLTQTDRRRLEAFEMWIWRRMKKISWLDKVTNEEVLRRVNEDRQILNSVWQRKRRWIGHVLRHDGLFCVKSLKVEWKVNQQEGEEEFKCYTIWQSDDGFVALKWAAEDREVWRHRERMSETFCTAGDYWWWG